jgi:hypothetical protein
MTLFAKGKANMGAKKTVTVSNHFGSMDFVLYNDDGPLITAKAKLLSHVKDKAVKASDTKVALVFKYDKSGILTV